MTQDGRRSAKLTSKDVIDYVETYAEVNHCKLYEAVEDIIRKHMNSQTMKAEKQNTYSGWIPCYERLPEEEVAVLVYEKGNKNTFTGINEDGRWVTFDVHDPVFFDETDYGNIVAWMPLPEPYKEYSIPIEFIKECAKKHSGTLYEASLNAMIRDWEDRQKNEP